MNNLIEKGYNCMKPGYVRVATYEQTTNIQEALLNELGIGKKVFIDRMSETINERPELKKVLRFIRQGDPTYVAASFIRFNSK